MQDEEQLNLLSVFHYVVGGILGFFSLFPCIHVAFGLAILFMPQLFHGKEGPPSALLGWLFLIVGLSLITLGWTMAVLILLAGRFLARRKHYLFCLVVGGGECLFMPFGTVLGAFTIVVLMRDGVKQLFASGA